MRGRTCNKPVVPNNFLSNQFKLVQEKPLQLNNKDLHTFKTVLYTVNSQYFFQMLNLASESLQIGLL